MDGRRAGAALVAVAALAGCGDRGGSASSYRDCLAKIGHLTSAYGQDTVRFADGALVKIVRTPTAADAQQLAPMAGGPQDPYGYVAFGRAVIAWKGGLHDAHLLAVENCLEGT